MQHIWRRREVPTVFWWGYLGERDHLEDLSIDGRIISKSILNKLDGRLWVGLFWHRTERQVVGCVEHLLVRLHKIWVIDWMRNS